MNRRILPLLITFALAASACGDPEPSENSSANNGGQNQNVGDQDAGGDLDATSGEDARDAGDDDDTGAAPDAGGDDPDVGDDPDAGGDPDSGDDPDAGPTFDPTWSWELEIAGDMIGFQRFDADYASSSIEVSCETDAVGLRLQARVPSPVPGCEGEEDVLPLMIPDYDENDTYTQSSIPGPWTSLTTPVVHAFDTNSGACFARPLFEREYIANFSTDADGITTLDLRIEGGFEDSFGSTSLVFTSDFVFSADACEPYDSGDPACQGGQTDCRALPGDAICTNSGCTLGSRCTYPTPQECAALSAADCQQNQQCDYLSDSNRCVLGTGFSFYPDDCENAQVTSQGQAFCESKGCVWRGVCDGGQIACGDVDLQDDLICTRVYGCTW